MAERTAGKPEISSQKRAIKLPPAIGDWTTYHPPQILVKKVKTGLYGFDRLSEDELDHVLTIHYRFIEQLFRQFKTDLRLGVEFFTCQVEQTTYLNFLRTITDPVAQGKIKLAGFSDPVQLLFDLNLANSLINHALGSSDLEPISRALTEAETIVLTTALNEYLPHYTKNFEQTAAAEYVLVSSPDVTLDQSISPASTFVFFLAEVALGDNPAGKIIFGYPVALLKNLVKTYKEKSAVKPLNFNRLSSAALNKILVNAKAVLGTTNLFMSELHSLEIGDVVSLDTAINSPVTLSLGNLLKVLCQPGQLNKKKAVRIAGFEVEEKLEVEPPLQFPEEEEIIEEPGQGASEVPADIESEEAVLPAEETTEEEEEEEFKEEDLFPEDFEDELKEEA